MWIGIASHFAIVYRQIDGYENGMETGDVDVLLSIGSSMQATAFIIIQCHYLRHIRRRPFVSGPIDEVGDPLNDAELGGVRVMCWSVFAFAMKAAVSEFAHEKLWWLSDIMCVAAIIFLIRS